MLPAVGCSILLNRAITLFCKVERPTCAHTGTKNFLNLSRNKITHYLSMLFECVKIGNKIKQMSRSKIHMHYNESHFRKNKINK